VRNWRSIRNNIHKNSKTLALTVMRMIWKKRKIIGKDPVTTMTVALPDWEGSRKKSRREGIWENPLANLKIMILKQWILSSLNLELG
jgi:hypothetical protein